MSKVIAEDPFADLAPPAPAKRDENAELWAQANSDGPVIVPVEQANVAAAPAAVKILKRRNTADRRAQAKGALSSKELETRARQKEEEYQRARERIFGSADGGSSSTAAAADGGNAEPAAASNGAATSGKRPGSSASNHDAAAADGSSSRSETAVTPTSSAPASASASTSRPRSKPNSNYGDDEDMSEYRRLPHGAYGYQHHHQYPQYQGYARHPNPPPPPHAHYAHPANVIAVPVPSHVAVPASLLPRKNGKPATAPALAPAIGVVTVPGLPQYPIPLPPSIDELRALNLPAPPTPPPMPLVPNPRNGPAPFVLLGGGPGAAASRSGYTTPPSVGVAIPPQAYSGPSSRAASRNASRNASPTRGAVSPGGAAQQFAGIDAQMAGMQLGGGAPPYYASNGGRGGAHHQANRFPPPQQSQQQQGRGGPANSGSGGGEIRRSRSNASGRGRGRLWTPNS
ncbi:hypothetical protein H9P43_004033 [Blastocladiella emersonii ATCC 22665]|nr:hypothetical protein H9P43_004033 [Blastocladiella emersonii ATCC 22665]